MRNPMSMDGRVVLVTGAARGIGRAISELAIELGAKVAGVDLDRALLDEVAGAHPGRFLPLCGNVTDEKFVGSAVEQAVSGFGAVHGLVNNAGITRPAMIDRMSRADWDLVMDVHVNGSFLFTQAVGRHLVSRAKSGDPRPGAIVSISSDAGRRGTLGQINYATAKSALFGMTMSAAREWGRFGIRANVVCYGVVETAMTETIRTDERFRETYLSQIPLARWASTDEAAVPVCFLLSEGASYITGQVLSVNGGYTIAL